MAVLKCKMCGGDLTITKDTKIVECEFCGTKQTIPGNDNEKKTNLFNRANRLRIASEFDRAAGILPKNQIDSLLCVPPCNEIKKGTAHPFLEQHPTC